MQPESSSRPPARASIYGRAALRAGLAVCTGVWLVACSRGPEFEPAFGGKAPNIILISIDSLRSDHLSCYGYERETSPNIDALADEGLLFETMVSSTSWTLPAHAAMFTGLPDSVHGANRTARTLLENRETLAERLADAGYQTAGFWSGPYLAPHFGLDQGFEHYESCAGYSIDHPDELRHRKDSEGPGAAEYGADIVGRAHSRAHDDVTSPLIVERVEQWWQSRDTERPFFLFVHMWDVHYDFIPPEPYDGFFTDPEYTGDVDGRRLNPYLAGDLKYEGADLDQLVGLYDGEIAWTDHHVGMLLELIEEVAGDTVVVLTSDHGEEFYEHGRFGHRKTLREESVRVPLIMRFPDRIEPARTGRIARTVDLAPTLTHLAGAEPLTWAVGRSLIDLVQRETEPAAMEQLAVSELAGVGGGLLSVRTARWKLIGLQQTDRDEAHLIGLWDLVKDPQEVHNIAKDRGRPGLLKRAWRTFGEQKAELARLALLVGNDGVDVDVPDDLMGPLGDLGYTGPAGVDLAPELAPEDSFDPGDDH